MRIKFKQKCSSCRENYVVADNRQRFVMCYNCQKHDMQGEIKDDKIKELFNIPEEYYMENSFLRDIKIKYLRYLSLTEKQIEAFKKTIERMKNEKNHSK